MTTTTDRTPIRQQPKGRQLQLVGLRLPRDLVDWLRAYAQSQDQPITLNQAAADAIAAYQATQKRGRRP